MPDPVTPTPEQQPEPTYAELRKMISEDPESTATVETTETPVAPAGEKTAAVEPEPAPAPEPDTKEPEHKESAIDRRFSKLSRQRDEARAETDRLRRELEEARKAQPGPATEAKPAEAAKPVETGKPVPPDSATWTGTWDELEKAKLDYSEKLADWKVERALAARDQKAVEQQQQAESKQLHQKWEERATAAATKDAEFQDAIAEIGPFVTAAGVADLIKQSDVGPEIVMHLYRNQEEGLKIAKLGNPVLIAREIGKLEAKLLSAQGSTPQKPAVAAKPLPKPPAVIGGGSTPGEVDLSTCDQATFNREMRKILATT